MPLPAGWLLAVEEHDITCLLFTICIANGKSGIF
jgi:hypothetical protein